MITNITKDNFENEVLKADKPVLVDFWAAWCGPCKMLGPVLEEVSNEMADKAAFFGIDCDENPQLAAQFGVSSIPCLVVLKNGKMVTHQVGFQPKPALVAWLNGVL